CGTMCNSSFITRLIPVYCSACAFGQDFRWPGLRVYLCCGKIIEFARVDQLSFLGRCKYAGRVYAFLGKWPHDCLSAIAGPNPRQIILCKHKMYLSAVWPRRLVVQDVRFSS